jgi:hypothetical protein
MPVTEEAARNLFAGTSPVTDKLLLNCFSVFVFMGEDNVEPATTAKAIN